MEDIDHFSSFGRPLEKLLLIFISFLFFFGNLNVKASNNQSLNQDYIYLPLQVNIPRSKEPIKISSEDIVVKSKWSGPEIKSDLEITDWRFQKRNIQPGTLAGKEGKLIQDYFTTSGLQLCREVWISKQKGVFAIRQRLTNRKDEAIHLNNMYPFHIDKNNLNYKENAHAGQWDVLLQKRYKNGLPQVISPPGNEVQKGDQFSLFQFDKKQNSPVLFIGYLSWHDHLARFLINFNEESDKTYLQSFKAQCQFDGVVVPPGGQRTSRWVMLGVGSKANPLIRDYADKVGIYHGVKPPADDPPSVFCTWYFFGLDYNEKWFQKDLKALQELAENRNRMPFDVFLIDECWQLLNWGDFEAVESFPGGMKAAADKIEKLGYIPGIWTPPYLVDPGTDLAEKHPEWLLKDEKGERITFHMNDMDHWVLDPTYPGVTDYLEEAYRKLSKDWGYEYFKFDFMRAVIRPEGQQFYDSTKTRFQAYREGLKAIRKGVGPDAYLSMCGGHYGASLGIVNSQRSGSDVKSMWNESLTEYRQNILRTWMNRLWHTDADAMMIRKREEKFKDMDAKTLGLFTDAEARTNALNQYLGGGIVTFTEFMPELGDDRRALYRHVIPSVGSKGIPLDIFDHKCPNYIRNHVEPSCESLASWNTISIVNWREKDMDPAIPINSQTTEGLLGTQFLAFEFFSQQAMGIYELGDTLELETLSPHHSKLIRLVPWNGKDPVLAGTDLHFSGGAAEISQWNIDTKNNIRGKLETQWSYPITIKAVFPSYTKGHEYHTRSVKIHPSQKEFVIRKRE